MKKLGEWSFRKILLLALCILVAVKIIFDFNGFWALFSMAGKAVVSLLSYILVGFIIAYVLNSYVNFWRNKVLKRWTKNPNAKKYVTIIIGYATFIGIVALVLFSAVPELYSSVTALGKEIPGLIQEIMDFFERLLAGSSTALPESVVTALDTLIEKSVNAVVNLFDFSIVTSVFTATTGVIFNAAMGIMMSVYMLLEKENVLHAIDKILYAVFPHKTSRRIKWAGRKINEVFQKYFTGKLIQAFTVAIVAYIVFLIAKVPYAILFAVIIGVCNMVPYIGPWVGAVPAIVVSLADSFWLGVTAAACVLIIQALDNWVISPKVIGDQIGISPLLILIGLCIGGSLFGIPGMILGDVMAALVKIFFYDTYVEIKGRKKMRIAREKKKAAVAAKNALEKTGAAQEVSAEIFEGLNDSAAQKSETSAIMQESYERALYECFDHNEDEIDSLFIEKNDINDCD
ncbi:MAG: AI-2E family transporter [Clostridia bacterium]|nr:AI-2E family transporter [Clostridia bacterium]